MNEVWRLRLNADGPSQVVSERGRVITIPLRCGNSRVGRGDSIRWSAQVAKGLAAQLNGPRDLYRKEMA